VHGRWLRRTVAAGAIGLGAAVALAGPATAAGGLRIVAPADDALITGSSVDVRVHAGDGVRVGKVLAAGARGRDVTARLRPAGRHHRTLRLRVGPDLTPGPNTVFVRGRLPSGRETTVARTFTVARPRAGLLRVRAPRGPVRAAPVPVSLRLLGDGTRLRVRLNGRDAFGAFAERRGRRWTARLARNDGLRFGPNRLVVTAYDPKRGTYQRDVRTFRVRRTAPLVGAGPDRVARVGDAVRLAGQARPARRGDRVSMRWRIVARPAGSRARLIGARSARPRLVPDVPGHYRIQLHAREHPRPRATARASQAPATPTDPPATTLDPPATTIDPPPVVPPPATTVDPPPIVPTQPITPGCPPSTTPLGPTPPDQAGAPGGPIPPSEAGDPGGPTPPVQGGGPTPPADSGCVVPALELEPGKDTLDLAAQPAGLPQIPVSTTTDDNSPVITVGDTQYPMNAPQGQQIQLLILDGTTLQPDAVNFPNGTYNQSFFGTVEGVAQLQDVVKSIPSDDVVIAGGTGRACCTDVIAVGELAAALEMIGATFELGLGQGGLLQTLSSGLWSVIGATDLDPGQAHQLMGLTQSGQTCAGGSPVCPGEMHGFFRLGSDGQYTFAWAPTYLTFDTQPDGSATTNAITVAGQTYASDPGAIPAGSWGYQLLWLDADTLQFRGNFTYAAQSVANPFVGQPGVWEKLASLGPFSAPPAALSSQLQQIAADPTPGFIVLTTIGQPAEMQLWTGSAGDNPPGQDWINGSMGGFQPNDLWAMVAMALETFGGNPYAVLGPAGTPPAGTELLSGDANFNAGLSTTPVGPYTLVGVAGLDELGPNQGAELATAVVNAIPGASQSDKVSSNRIVGTLRRNRQGLLVPAATGSPELDVSPQQFDAGLTALLAQPAQPFPTLAEMGTATAAAMQYLFDNLDFSGQMDPVYGLRAAYWTDNESQSTWNSLAAMIQSGKNRDDQPMNGQLCAATMENCTEAAYDALASQLVQEFIAVGNVAGLFGRSGPWATIYTQLAENGTITFASVSGEIVAQYTNLAAQEIQALDALAIADGATSIVSGLGEALLDGAFPEGAMVLGVVADLIEGSLEVAGGATASADGGDIPAFDAGPFEVKASSFATVLGKNFSAMAQQLDTIQDLLVSDQGRLAAAGQATAAGGAWDLSGAQQEAVQNQLQFAMQQYVWLSLLPGAVGVYECIHTYSSDAQKANDPIFSINAPTDDVPGTGLNGVVPQYQWIAGPGHLYPPSGSIQGLIDASNPPAGTTPGLGIPPEYLVATAQMNGSTPTTPGFIPYGDGC